MRETISISVNLGDRKYAKKRVDSIYDRDVVLMLVEDARIAFPEHSEATINIISWSEETILENGFSISDKGTGEHTRIKISLKDSNETIVDMIENPKPKEPKESKEPKTIKSRSFPDDETFQRFIKESKSMLEVDKKIQEWIKQNE